MKATKEQSLFVESVFDYYHMDKYGFFTKCDHETGKDIEIPLEIDERLAHTLGMTIDEIIAMDETAAMKWGEKYPFFKYYHGYHTQWDMKFRYADEVTQEDLLIKSIFRSKFNVEVKERYDYRDVRQRLVNQLMEIDKVIPGTFHKNAEMTKTEITTEVFFSFPQVLKMVSSFIDIYNRVETLFFKILSDDLTADEIQEYDFLVSAFQITDYVVSTLVMTYDYVKSIRKVCLSEGYHKLTSYARIRNFIETAPWRCKEFYNDVDLVSKFAAIFPEAKAKMREFSMKVSNFECHFTWSDAKPIVESPEDEEAFRVFCESLGEEYPEPENRAKEPTLVYVPKTDAEMGDWALYVHRLKKLAQPSAKGGLLLPKPEASNQALHDIHRIMNRSLCRRGGTANG